MSITKSYNKYNNTYYAYETSYEWDESKKKKVQKRRASGSLILLPVRLFQTGRLDVP